VIEVSVPATSANLGSGFDAIALALDMRMHARAVRGTGGLRPQFTGAEAPTHDGISEMVLAGMRPVAEDPVGLDLDVTIDNAIPLGVGLGSSAAAVICGMVLAAEATGRTVTSSEIVRAVAQVEGHADNAAAAVYGRLCIVAHDARETSVLKASLPRGLCLTLVIPERPLNTRSARAALPQLYTRSAVSLSIQRASLLAAALTGGHYEMLAAATRDIVHQPYRAEMFPGLKEALALRHADAVAVLSGSGPSVLLLSREPADEAPLRVAQCFEREGAAARIVRAELDAAGLLIRNGTQEETLMSFNI